MPTYTTRLAATKPASAENVSVDILDANFDLFDLGVGSSVGTSASRPASAFQGRLYYTTDTTKMFVNTAANASTAATWADPVANALTSAVTIGGDLAMSAGAVNVTRSASSSNAFTAKVSGDAQNRYQVRADGQTSWGNGASAVDTNLYRSAADMLKTDDSLTVGQGLTVVGTVTASTNVNVGGALTANGGLTVVGKGEKTYVRKSSTTSKASDTTYASDPHLTFTLAASAVYFLRLTLSVAGASAADFKTQYVFTGAASGGNHSSRMCNGPSTATTDATNGSVRLTKHNWTTGVTYGTDGTNTSSIEESGLIETLPGSGTITLQWAQNTSNATSTTVSTSSFGILERLA